MCDGVAKLKFSEVRKMFREHQVEMDVPGVWLMAAAERQEPEAWGVLATWFARGHRGKCGMDVLSCLLNGAADVRVMDKAPGSIIC